MPDSLKTSVSQSNQLIEASYSLSMTEKKILLMAIAQIKKGEAVTEKTQIFIHASQYAKLINTDVSRAYHVLIDSVDRLYERSIYLTNGDGDNVEKDKFRWIQQVKYNQGNGELMIRFSTPILPYIQQLSERFTTYQLEDIAAMTSSHAIRLYELLAQYKDIGKRRFEVVSLRNLMDLGEKYSAHKDFKKWVIDASVLQINKQTPLKVTYSQIKSGRKITHIDFSIFNKDKQLKLSELTGIGGKK